MNRKTILFLTLILILGTGLIGLQQFYFEDNKVNKQYNNDTTEDIEDEEPITNDSSQISDTVDEETEKGRNLSTETYYDIVNISDSIVVDIARDDEGYIDMFPDTMGAEAGKEITFSINNSLERQINVDLIRYREDEIIESIEVEEGQQEEITRVFEEQGDYELEIRESEESLVTGAIRVS